jgi:hypothetical protein
MPELNKDIALFPPVVLDNLSTSSWWESGNKVLKHYIPASLKGIYSNLKRNNSTADKFRSLKNIHYDPRPAIKSLAFFFLFATRFLLPSNSVITAFGLV